MLRDLSFDNKKIHKKLYKRRLKPLQRIIDLFIDLNGS